MKLTALSITAALTVINAGSALASWTLIDDFQGLSAGDTVSGTTGPGATWDGDGLQSAQIDPSNPSNVAMQLGGTQGNSVLRGQFSSGNIAAGTTGTLFYRFRTNDSSVGTADAVVALTDNPAITNFNFKSGLRNTNPVGPNNMDVRNGGSYESVATLASNTWYSLWMVSENTNPGTFEVFLQSDTDAAFATQTQLVTALPESEFDYRINGDTDIVNAYFRGASNGGGVAGSDLYYDDIWLNADSKDLSNPIPEPASLSILMSGLAVFFIRRRR